jgi:MaoC like domain
VLSTIDQPDDLLDDEVVQNHLQSRKSAMTAITDFDPDAFLVVPARTFEDLRIGEVFRAPSRTLTDAHAAAFQTVSMDNHPVHYDAEWARTHGHVAPVVHGLQVLAFTAPGATLFPHFVGERLTGGVNRFGRRFPRRSGKSEEGAYVRVEEGIACRAAARTDR